MINQNLNKGISTPVGILIIVICALIVGGILAWQYWWVPKEEAPPVKPVAEPTADWKTYRNEEYGFQFKYPQDFRIDDSTNKGITKTDILLYLVKGENDIRFLIMKDYNWFSKNLGSVFNEIFEVRDKIDKKIEKINNYDMISGLIKTEPGDIYGVVISNKKDSAAIQANNPLEDKNLLYQILSTFKFLEQPEIDTSNWKTYRNEEYGFEVKYPREWITEIIFESSSDFMGGFYHKEFFSNPEGPGGFGLLIHINGNPESLDWEQWKKYYKPNLFSSEEIIYINNLKGVKVREGTIAEDYICVYFLKGTDVYSICISSEGERMDVFDYAVSTFRFWSKFNKL